MAGGRKRLLDFDREFPETKDANAVSATARTGSDMIE